MRREVPSTRVARCEQQASLPKWCGKTAGAGALAAAGGPIAALLVGGIALILFRLSQPVISALRLFLLTLGIIVLLWFCAGTFREALDQKDDWGIVAHNLGWPSLWRPVLGGFAAIGYVAVLRIASPLARDFASLNARRLALPYLATAVTAVFLGALWHQARVAPALDGLLSLGIAPLGYLLVIRTAARSGRRRDGGRIGRSWAWVFGSGILVALFVMTIARGVEPLA